MTPSWVRSFGPGFIAMWYGSVANIPKGWALCDGENGTPDLRDRFVAAAGNTYAVGDTGGLVQHNHSVIGTCPIHDISGGTDIAAGEPKNNRTLISNITGNTDNESLLPPYHGLLYIMEL